MVYYKINRRRVNAPMKYSIDQVDEQGNYICQEAFWFATNKAARERLAEMLAQDAANPQHTDSREYVNAAT